MTNVEVKTAGEKGDGLFAAQKIPKGQIVFIATGAIKTVRFVGDDCYLYPDWYMVTDSVWVDFQMPFIKANHSCDPNCGIYDSRLFIALRDIAVGDELTFDYSLTDDETDWVMGPTDCKCGAKDCRVSISSIHTVPPEHIARSYPYIMPYFLELWCQHNPKEVDSIVNKDSS